MVRNCIEELRTLADQNRVKSVQYFGCFVFSLEREQELNQGISLHTHIQRPAPTCTLYKGKSPGVSNLETEEN